MIQKLKFIFIIFAVCTMIAFAADIIRQQIYRQYVVSTSAYMDTKVDLIAHNTTLKKELVRRINDDFTNTIKTTSELFNIYNPLSVISKINNAFNQTTFILETDVFNVIDKAIYFSKLTDGYFDITVGSLVKLWKKAKKENTLPTDIEIDKALDTSGYKKIDLNSTNHSLKAKQKGISLNLSGIAKGYIVDKTVKKMQKLFGLPNIIVNAGGDLYAAGSSKRRFLWQKKGWCVGIKHPRKPHLLLGTVVISDKAVATSGDYERPLIIKGEKYSHIIDPKTGAPTKFIISATVIADSCADADALATAITVMGIDAGLDLIESIDGAEALIITEEENKTDLFFSSGFKNYGFKANKTDIVEKHFK